METVSGDRLLFTIVGNNDPYSGELHGPVLSFLANVYCSRAYLFCTGPDYFEKAKTIEQEAFQFSPGTKFSFISLELNSVIDYEEIFIKLKEASDRILERHPVKKVQVSVLLDPGTPQMQTCWFLLARAGYLRATLYQGIPPRFSGGIYRYREVNPESRILPEIIRRDNRAREEKPSVEKQWISTPSGQHFRGSNGKYSAILEKAEKIAGYDITVLVTGETGTGKGVLAQMIHRLSQRRDMPFLPVNCSGISSALAESELFGHLKGSFTGAERNRIGQFRAAEGGTIFLDEIGDLPLELQPKLLRVLEEKVVMPVGDEKEYRVNVRVIAATNRNLLDLIEKGLFRRDLYERLNQITISIPPLREHEADIPGLAAIFISEWNSMYGEDKFLDDEVTALFCGYEWPGNIRQLKNTVFSLCATSVSSRVTADLLPQEMLNYFNRTGVSTPLDFNLPEEGFNIKSVIYSYEKEMYLKALEKAGGNRENAARLLGINPPAFRKALRERFSMPE